MLKSILTNWQTTLVGLIIIGATIAKWLGDKNVNLTDFDVVVKLLVGIGFISAKDAGK